MINELNETFGVDGHIGFHFGKGNMPKAVIANEFASAEVYLHGAHVTSFRPHNSSPVLWMSNIAEFRHDKAIRGGIPVVWPWFGPHPNDDTKPQHGFARVSEWTLVSTTSLSNGLTQLRLQLTDSETTRTLWPHSFELELSVTVGTQLRIDLISRNTGAEPFIVGGALHTYFNIGDINRITIEGLEGREYLDQLQGHQTNHQKGPITISEEVDRIYLNTDDECIISDTDMKRRIRVVKMGSNTTVVWNPWIAKSQHMSDFPDDGFRSMVCVEATNTVDDIYHVLPGEEHTLTQIISVDDKY